MLSEQTISILKSTVSILEMHGETLTQYFYKRMFSSNPEVIPLFNPTNQANGTQQKALAGAICAYAANIDNLDYLSNVIELIAQKHSSLQIKPEHYPIVGENLLASIREILGPRATEEIINAWSEAYWFLANILINRESQIYHQHSSMSCGWEGFKNFYVLKKEKENDIITSFYLVPENGSKLPEFKPGQYITVRIPGPQGVSTMRNYSLSHHPKKDWFRISVKRETGNESNLPDGYVSNFLHEYIEKGSKLEIAPPCGNFFLDVDEQNTKPLVLLAAGIGITPILSILHSALELPSKRQIILIHGSLNERTQAFKSEIDKLALKHSNLKIHYRYSEPAETDVAIEGNCSTGFISAKLIESLLPNLDADYYFCGPKLFMVMIYNILQTWKIASKQMHFEFFGPIQELEKPQNLLSLSIE